jgi:hypothetical protein
LGGGISGYRRLSMARRRIGAPRHR